MLSILRIVCVWGVIVVSSLHYAISQCGLSPLDLEAQNHHVRHFSGPYSSTDRYTRCRWLIRAPDYNHVIRLTIDELALTSSNTCEQEYVEISDGTRHWVTRLDKLCPHFRGGQQYTSTDSSMSIFYYSEKPFSSRDARFRFSIMALPKTAHTSSRSDTHAVAYGILGMVGGVLIVCLVCCCLARKSSCDRVRFTTSSNTNTTTNTPRGRQSSIFTVPPVVLSSFSRNRETGTRDADGSGDGLSEADRPPRYADLSFTNGSVSRETESGFGSDVTITGSLPPSYSQSQLTADRDAHVERGATETMASSGRRESGGSVGPVVSFSLRPVVGEGEGVRRWEGQGEQGGRTGDTLRHTVSEESAASTVTPPPQYDDVMLISYPPLQQTPDSQSTGL